MNCYFCQLPVTRSEEFRCHRECMAKEVADLTKHFSTTSLIAKVEGSVYGGGSEANSQAGREKSQTSATAGF